MSADELTRLYDWLIDAPEDAPGVAADLAVERDAALARVRELEALLGESRRSHYYCEDCWYSCPKAPYGCCDDAKGNECDCGADAWNARIASVLVTPEDTP